jgi:hypothetical protein
MIMTVTFVIYTLSVNETVNYIRMMKMRMFGSFNAGLHLFFVLSTLQVGGAWKWNNCGKLFIIRFKYIHVTM